MGGDEMKRKRLTCTNCGGGRRHNEKYDDDGLCAGCRHLQYLDEKEYRKPVNHTADHEGIIGLHERQYEG